MNKEQFNNLDILTQVDYINKALANRASLTSICEKIGISRSTIRERFKKNGYIYYKDIHNYKSVIEVVTETTDKPTITKLKSSNLVVETDLEQKLNYIINNYENDLSKLNEVYSWYLSSKGNNSEDVINLEKLEILDFDGELITRSFKIYESIQQEFTQFCKRNNKYKVQDILSQALREFLDKYNF